MSCDWHTGEYSGIHCTTAASWRCYMKKYKDTPTTYGNVWHNDKEYLIYCFNKGWIKHPEIKKFVEANINMMEEVKLKHWAHRNRHHVRNIEKWWKGIMNKKYNFRTLFGLQSPRLIKKTVGRYGILCQIRERNGRCVSLKIYKKERREKWEKEEAERREKERLRRIAEAKKREERKKQEEERKNRPRSYSSDSDEWYGGGMWKRCGTIHPWG